MPDEEPLANRRDEITRYFEINQEKFQNENGRVNWGKFKRAVAAHMNVDMNDLPQNTKLGQWAKIRSRTFAQTYPELSTQDVAEETNSSLRVVPVQEANAGLDVERSTSKQHLLDPELVATRQRLTHSRYNERVMPRAESIEVPEGGTDPRKDLEQQKRKMKVATQTVVEAIARQYDRYSSNFFLKHTVQDMFLVVGLKTFIMDTMPTMLPYLTRNGTPLVGYTYNSSISEEVFNLCAFELFSRYKNNRNIAYARWHEICMENQVLSHAANLPIGKSKADAVGELFDNCVSKFQNTYDSQSTMQLLNIYRGVFCYASLPNSASSRSRLQAILLMTSICEHPHTLYPLHFLKIIGPFSMFDNTYLGEYLKRQVYDVLRKFDALSSSSMNIPSFLTFGEDDKRKKEQMRQIIQAVVEAFVNEMPVHA